MTKNKYADLYAAARLVVELSEGKDIVPNPSSDHSTWVTADDALINLSNSVAEIEKSIMEHKDAQDK